MGCSLCSLTPKQNRLYHFFFGDPACFCSSLNYLYIPATVNKIEHLSFPSKSFFFLVVEPGSYAEKIARDWDYCYFYLNSYDWLDEELEEILQGAGSIRKVAIHATCIIVHLLLFKQRAFFLKILNKILYDNI